MPIKTACRGVLINRQCLEMHLANFRNKCQYSKIPTKLFARTGIAGRNSKNVEYCINKFTIEYHITFKINWGSGIPSRIKFKYLAQGNNS